MNPTLWTAKCPVCKGILRNKPYHERPQSTCRKCGRIFPALKANGVSPAKRR